MQNKKLLLLLPLGLLIGACGNAKTNNNVYIYYDYNYKDAGKPVSFVVSKNKNPLKPTDPTRTGYVFDGWYLDEDCTSAFKDFDKPLTNDLFLHAKWIDVSSLDETQTISILNSKIAEYSGKPAKSSTKSHGVIQYYMVNPPLTVGFESIENFERYEDAVISTLYGPNQENGKLDKVVNETQTIYDDKNLYYLSTETEFNEATQQEKIYKDKHTYKYSEENKESMFNINFFNMAMVNSKKLEQILKGEYKGEIIPEAQEDFDPIEYSIDIDRLTNSSSFTFSLNYQTTTKPKQDDPSAIMQQVYEMNATIYFNKGLINKAIVDSKSLIGLANSPLQFIQSTDEYDFDHDAELGRFEGTKWNPEDFEEVEE